MLVVFSRFELKNGKELMLLVLPISQHREPRTADKKLCPVKTVVTGVSAEKLMPHYFYKTTFAKLLQP